MTIATDTANFLGYTLTAGGYTVDTGRCKIIKEYPRPTNAREVKKFLGIANYFRRLIKNYSKRSAPLRELLAKDRTFTWTDAQESSFCDIRDTLCSAPVLGYPDRDKLMRVILDACATGLGYILVNVNADGSETPLFFSGRSTTRAERHFSATELELSALLAAVKAFYSYLANVEFEIVTDHISLTYLKGLRAGPSKLARASAQLAQFRFKVTHLAGKSNSAADSISRMTDLQTDPLTAHEAARFVTDDVADLQLDYATADRAFDTDSKSFRDVGVQCDACEIGCINLDGELSDIAHPSQPPKPQRSKRIRTHAGPPATHGIARAELNISTISPETHDQAAHSNPDCATATGHDDGDINLRTQHEDPMLADMIDYLQHGELPDNDKTARKVLLTEDQFTIRDNKLLHLGIKRQKNNQTEQPITEQVCVPNSQGPAVYRVG